MATPEPVFEDVLDMVKQLTPRQQLRLIEAIAADLKEKLQLTEVVSSPLRSVYGLWKDLDIDVSSDDIDEARQELWGAFPREDV